MSVRPSWAGAFLLFACFACSANPVTVVVRSFDQANAIAFVCFEAIAGADSVRDTLPLAACDTTTGTGGVMHALVTQKRPGELATVDLSVDANEDNIAEGRVLDLDGRVPGATFLSVGELPTAVVIPETGSGPAGGPRYAYVASFGSQDISVLPVERLVRQEAGVATPPIPTPVSVRAYGGITDLALSVDGSRLLAAVPDAGAVLIFAVADEGRTLNLEQALALGSDVPASAQALEEPDYCWSCTEESTTVAETCGSELLSAWPQGGVFPPRVPVALGGAPRPVSFWVDDEDHTPGAEDRILVADESLPIVHVLDGATGAPLPGFSLSVPLAALALTPTVPSRVGEATGSARYLYALDATDGSLLVADYASQAVLPVSVVPDGPADRVTMPGRVRALTVAAPTATSQQDPGPFRLSGVFAVAAGVDGFVRLIDVADREIQQRTGASGQCLGEALALRRHRPRIGATPTASYALASNPRVTREGQVASMDEQGQSDLSISFAPVTCARGEKSVFGDSTRLCALADPWTARDEEWTVRWEGTLPGALGSRGQLAPEGSGTTTALLAGLPFCELGVLGRDNSAGLGGGVYGGDQLVVEGPIPAAFSEACREQFLDEFGELGRVSFPVLQSFAAGLRLGSPLPVLRGGRGSITVTTAEVTACFGQELARFSLRAFGRYVVSGTVSPFAHPVVVDEGGVPDAGLGLPCRVDSGRVARARAPHGLPFSSGRLRFSLDGALPVSGEDVSIRFLFANARAPIAIPVGSPRTFSQAIPASAMFNRFDQRLYLVDEGQNGLVPYQLTILEVRPAIN